jgi:hypothetical protein
MGQDNSKERIKSEYLSEWEENRLKPPTPEHNYDGFKTESEIKQELTIDQLSKLQFIKKIEFWYGVIATLIIIGIILTIIFTLI